MKFNKSNIFVIIAILLFGVSIVVALLILSNKLQPTFWFASIFAIAAASTFLGQKSIEDAKRQTEERRKAREERKNREKNRYI